MDTSPTFSIVHISLALTLIFSAFNTQGNMQELVIKSIQKEDPSFRGSGFISLSIIYIVFAAFNWVTPSVLSVTGPKLALVLGSSTYLLFVGSFIWPSTWLLYLCSFLAGVGAAFVWTGVANYVTSVSQDKTIDRNTGIFWSIISTNFLFGNLYVYHKFQGRTHIGYDTRLVVFGVLSLISAIGVLLMCFLANPNSKIRLNEGHCRDERNLVASEDQAEGRRDLHITPVEALLKTMVMYREKNMLLLLFTFLYAGVTMSFITGVYSVCIGFTTRFSDSKKLVPLSGICIGSGEIVGGTLLGVLGKRITIWGRDPIILLGYIIYIGSYYLIFLNIPASSVFGDTSDPSYFAGGQPNVVVALLCSILLGFADSCYNTQIFSMLGTLYPKESSQAFAIFRFNQCLAAGASFYYATAFDLRTQLLILIIFATLGTISFFLVEWGAHNELRGKTIESDMKISDQDTNL